MPDQTAGPRHRCDCQAKPWRASRVLWFNAAAAAVAAAEGSLGMLRPLLGEHVFPVLTFAVVLGNCVLRAVTIGPIAFAAPSAGAAGAADEPGANGRDPDDEART